VKRLYAIHRWIAGLAALQLLVWAGSGLFFAVAPMDRVKGEDRIERRPPETIVVDRLAPVPRIDGVVEVSLKVIGGRALYSVRARDSRVAFDAISGARVTIDAAFAEAIARTDQRGQPRARSVERIETAPVEYRGKPVPAWRVELDDDRHTVIYVDAHSGEVTARRNDLWRAFDFAFGLHVMSYQARDGSGNALLAAFAALGLLTAISGAALWGLRIRKRWRAPTPD
jgi:hypothetical protein